MCSSLIEMSSTGNASGSASGNASGNAGSILSKLNVLGLFSKSKNNSVAKQPNSKVTALPVTAQGGMRGGMASVSHSTPYDMRQPSERIMYWATTADAKTPTGPEMRRVAHGGKRRKTHKRKTHCKSKRSHKHTMKRKTHRRRHSSKRRHSRRN